MESTAPQLAPPRPSTRRGSLIPDALRRLSVELVMQIGVLDEGLPPHQHSTYSPAHVAPDDDSITTMTSTSTQLYVVDHPVSLLNYTARSNLDSVISGLPASVLIYCSNLLVIFVISEGGIWGDSHAALCAVCMACTEAVFFIVNNISYAVRRLLVGIPINIICNILLSCFLFDWRPGGIYVPAITTLSFFISGCAVHPLIPDTPTKPKKPFLAYAKYVFIITFGTHGGVVVFIHALVIPTRLLAKSGNEILTLLVTGLVFPGCAFVVRKTFQSIVQMMIDRDTTSSLDDKIKMFSNMSKIMSALVMFLPTVLMYLNTNVTLAMLSALAQLVTENACKICVVLFMKKGMDEELADAAGDPDTIELLKKTHKYRFAMLAIRWHAELVAEKGSIMNAAVVAYLYLSDMAGTSKTHLIVVGILFFFIEMISDVIFVYAMHNWFDVPILSAVPSMDVLSKDNIASGAAMALSFTIMSACIAMAANVPL
jgi:hypothetical protein